MIHKIGGVFAVLFLVLGCARVQVVAPKDPIKVDIAMRLDVYQHVEKDINTIENIVSGNTPAGKLQSMLDHFVGTAYAEECLPAEVEEAAMRRKARYQDLTSAESSGRIGENKSGFVELRAADTSDAPLNGFVSAENSMGFHNSQEALRMLAAATDLARQAELKAVQAGGSAAVLNK